MSGITIKYYFAEKNLTKYQIWKFYNSLSKSKIKQKELKCYKYI